MSYFIGQKEAEISLSPTIIIPLSTAQNKPYRVRTLLDSGSMTNWIAKELLKTLKYTTKGHNLLEVITMTGKTQKRFQLVELYFSHKEKEDNLMCYVFDEFTKHITVKGLPDHIKNNSEITQGQFEKIVDPATNQVDHKDISLGIGMILCTSSVNKLRTEEAVIHLKGLNILLEPTIFGTAISGEVPQSLRGSVNTVCSHNIAPRLVSKNIFKGMEASYPESTDNSYDIPVVEIGDVSDFSNLEVSDTVITDVLNNYISIDVTSFQEFYENNAGTLQNYDDKDNWTMVKYSPVKSNSRHSDYTNISSSSIDFGNSHIRVISEEGDLEIPSNYIINGVATVDLGGDDYNLNNSQKEHYNKYTCDQLMDMYKMDKRKLVVKLEKLKLPFNNYEKSSKLKCYKKLLNGN